jgi:hypothetical protein
MHSTRALRFLRLLSLPAVLATALLAGSPAVASLPVPVAQTPYGLQQVGRGELRWLGFGIYEASLWSADGRYAGPSASGPVALSLWYQRKFTREQLIDITTGEWQRLGLGAPDARARWETQLRGLWRDVERGDNLTAVVIPGLETRFYDATRLLGRIEDPSFGPAFLSIWLDSRSAVRDLGVQLLGTGSR